MNPLSLDIRLKVFNNKYQSISLFFKKKLIFVTNNKNKLNMNAKSIMTSSWRSKMLPRMRLLNC